MMINGSELISLRNLKLFIWHWPLASPKSPNVINTVTAVWKELSLPIPMFAVTDPKVITTAKSKKVIWDKAFLPNIRAMAMSMIKAKKVRRIAYTISIRI